LWGHEAGDRVLERLGAVFRTESRSVDIVGRLGGEEFVALLPTSDAAETLAYAERIRAAFASSVDREVPNVTVSAGVIATAGPEGATSCCRRPTQPCTQPSAAGATAPSWTVRRSPGLAR
jgi:diguanylate cyclase (GGDEF)-like protein